MRSETCFHSEHRGLGQRTAVVADSFFPAFATVFANAANRFVTRQRQQFAVTVLLDLRISSRRNDRSDLAFRQLAVNLPFVICPIAVKLADLVGNFLQQIRNFRSVIGRFVRQIVRHDFLRFGVNRQMKLSLCSMFCPTVFFHFPLAFAEHLQAGAIDDNIDFTFFVGPQDRNTKFRRSFAQRSVIRNRKVELHDREYPTPEAFGVTIRQSEQFPHRQQCLNGQVAEDKGVSLALFGVVVLPLFEDFAGKPKSDVTSVDQRLVIFCPISDLVSRSRYVWHRLLHKKVLKVPFTIPNTNKMMKISEVSNI